MRNIKKFAKDNGLEFVEGTNAEGYKVMKVTIGKTVFTMEERESTAYYSINGWEGNSEKYSMNASTHRYTNYFNTQREMIEHMTKFMAKNEEVEEVQAVEEETEYEQQLDAEIDAMFETQEAETAEAKKAAKIEKAEKMLKEYDDEIEAAMQKVFGDNLNDTMIDRLCEAAKKNGQSIGRGQSAKYTFKRESDDVGYYCSVWIGDRKIGEVLPCDYRFDFFNRVDKKMYYNVSEIKEIEKIMFYNCEA